MPASNTRLQQFFLERRQRNEPMVLATVVATEGSTYRKAGAQMLVAGDGAAAGLLSGGCLESDLIERAQRVLSTGAAALVSYDTRSSDDVIWGIGLGCEGAMNILLTLLHAGNAYEPFAFIAAARANHVRAAFALVVHPGGQLQLGEAFRSTEDGKALLACSRDLEIPLALPQAQTGTPAAQPHAHELVHDGARLLVVPIALPLRVLILGAGPDAQPLVQIAALMGWQVTVADHRPAYAVADRFPGAAEVRLSAAAELGSNFDVNAFDAAVVMSHHLISDEAYLRVLAESRVSYVGLLGPAPRRTRLLAELGERSTSLAGRLRGPVGLDIGANTPETIALAIASEIQAALTGRSGRPFTETH